MGKLGLPAQFQPSDHQSFPELLQSEVEDVISALVEYFKIPRDKIKPEHLQTIVFSHCMSFYLTHLCSGRTDTGDGLFYTSRFYNQIGDKRTDGGNKMNTAARWFQCGMMLSVTECSLKSVGPYGIKFGNLQKESADANEATILCLARLGEKPENQAPLYKLAHLPNVRKFIRPRGPTVPIIRQRKRLNFTIGEHVTILEYQDVFAKVTYRVPDIFTVEAVVTGLQFNIRMKETPKWTPSNIFLFSYCYHYMKLTDDAWTHKGVKDISRDRASGPLQIHGFDWVTNRNFALLRKLPEKVRSFLELKLSQVWNTTQVGKGRARKY